MKKGAIGLKKNELLKKIDKAVENQEDELIEFLQGLIKIPTENPPGNNYPECAEFIGNKMKELGCHVNYVEVPEERLEQLAPHGKNLPRVSVIGDYGRNSAPCLHFSGHFDVVPAGTNWSVDPFSGVLKEGKIYGRGASDQKSGIAAQVFALSALLEANIDIKGKFISSATPDEETGGFAGVGYLVQEGFLDQSNTDYCVITECLDHDKVCLGHRGTLWFEITTHGKQSHGSMPSEGINAIDKMRSLIDEIEKNIMPLLGDRSIHPIRPEKCKESTLAVTMIEAGNKINTVPGSCKASFDWRLIPEQDLTWAKEKIIETCDAWKQKKNDSEDEMHLIHDVEPVLVPDHTRVVKTFVDAGAQVLNKQMDYTVSPGSDDQRFVVNQGGLDQCIVYGPGTLALAHQSDEYIRVSELKQAVKVMALSAAELLNDQIEA